MSPAALACVEMCINLFGARVGLLARRPQTEAEVVCLASGRLERRLAAMSPAERAPFWAAIARIRSEQKNASH